MENTSTGEKRNDHYDKNVPQEGVKSNGEDGIPPRASIRFDRSTGQAILTLFEAADASSFVHELWHIALDDLIRLGASENASEQAKADRLAALQWLGSTDGKLTAEQHEKWAEAGEAYFTTGKAPTPKLQGVFARMRQWMLDIYGMIRAGQGVQIPEHIQDVFDRILATPEDIDASYEENTLFGTLAGQNKLLKERVAEIDEQLADTERRLAEAAETGEPPVTDVAGEEETYRQSANVNEIIESIRNNEFLHISMEDIAQTYGEDILAMLPEGIVSEDASCFEATKKKPPCRRRLIFLAPRRGLEPRT